MLDTTTIAIGAQVIAIVFLGARNYYLSQTKIELKNELEMALSDLTEEKVKHHQRRADQFERGNKDLMELVKSLEKSNHTLIDGSNR